MKAYGMDRVLAEARSRVGPLSKISPEALSAIWNAFCSTLSNTLRSGKGMRIDQFGTFSFHLGVKPARLPHAGRV